MANAITIDPSQIDAVRLLLASPAVSELIQAATSIAPGAYYSYATAAALTGYSTDTIGRAVRAGKLGRYGLAGDPRVLGRELIQWMEKRAGTERNQAGDQSARKAARQ